MLIFLIGMMGSGKTTIGKALSQKLRYFFIDLDEEIERQSKMTIKEIIEQKGIESFRALEKDVLTTTKYDINTVIATGGGIVLDHQNVLFMKSQGITIYLSVLIDHLVNRFSKIDYRNRPLLKEPLENTLRQLVEERQSLYEAASQITIDCFDLTEDEVVTQIILELSK